MKKTLNYLQLCKVKIKGLKKITIELNTDIEPLIKFNQEMEDGSRQQAYFETIEEFYKHIDFHSAKILKR